jgi:hypothetical protein
MTDIPPEPGTVLELLVRDHLVIRGLLDRFDITATDEWGGVFRDLSDYLVRHEIAEQEVVYPALSAAFPGSRSAFQACTGEEDATVERLAAMELLSPLTREFRSALGHLRDALDAHIAHEDQLILPMIRSLGLHEDGVLADRYEVARTLAAGRAYPAAAREAR